MAAREHRRHPGAIPRASFGFSEKAHLEPDPDAGHQLIGSAWFLTELDADGKTTVTLRVTITKIGSKAKLAAFGMKMGYKAHLDNLHKLLGSA